MKVLVAGLTRQSGAAVEMIVSSVFRGAELSRRERGESCTWPLLVADAGRCDLIVLDLAGIGWSRRTVEREATLQGELLDTVSAIVLLPPGDNEGWAKSAAVLDSRGACIALAQPASMQAMQEALLELSRELEPKRSKAPGARRSAAAPGSAKAAAVVSSSIWGGLWSDPPVRLRRAPAADDASAWAPTQAPDDALPRVPAAPEVSLAPEPAHLLHEALAAVAPRPAVGPAADPALFGPSRPGELDMSRPGPPRAPHAFELTAADLAAIRAACPALSGQPFLLHLVQAAMRGQAVELRVGKRSAAVLHPAQNWVTWSVATAVRRRLARYRLMLDLVEFRPLQPADVMPLSQALFGRRSDGRRPLDGFIFSLTYASFEDEPPALDARLGLELRVLPDFTRLGVLPDAYLQLAVHALRRPTSVGELTRTFGEHPAEAVNMFVLAALLSGMARLLPTVADQPATVPTARAEPLAAKTPRVGFLRALLARLF